MMRPGIAALAVGLGACALVADIEQFERGAAVVTPFDGGVAVGPGADGGADAPIVAPDGAPPGDAPLSPCGACPGQCESDGACVLATGLSAKTLALVGDLVVFGEESAGRARACPQLGCTASGPVVIREGLDGARVLRPERGGGKPVLLDRSTVYELVANGTAPAVQSSLEATVAQLSDTVLALGSPSGVFWCMRGSGGGFGGCQQIGGSGRPTLALSGNVIVWAGANAGIATFDTADPSATGVSNHTAAGGAPASWLAADSASVFGIAGSAIYRWPLDGGQAQKIADVSDAPRSLSLDEARIYLAGTGVRVVDKSSGQIVTRFPSRQTIDVVASAQYVFWLESTSLMRAAK
jgi:hypothetical protein